MSEAIGILLRVTSNHGDEGEREEDEDQDDLASAEPELSFTIGFDCKHVEETKCEVSIDIGARGKRYGLFAMGKL